MTPRLAITAGEPAGIGPELVVRLAQHRFDATLVAIGSRELLHATARALSMPFELDVIDVPLAADVVAGEVDPRNARHVVDMLAHASDGALRGDYDAIVTAPVHKGVINDGGVAFTGHTEFFAERAKAHVVMMLAAPGLNVALATTHLPLAAVPSALSIDAIVRDVGILARAFERPRIAVLGLNPHAGEGGHLGREEIDVIGPACDALRAQGIDVTGPLSADTAFVPDRRARFDAYFAMYHDQGLPVLKALGFGDSVNLTLGLPYVRTSVDHGVALDLAGKGVANVDSLVAATKLAIAQVRRRAERRA